MSDSSDSSEKINLSDKFNIQNSTFNIMQRVIVIAEAGVNHNGSFDLAVEMIDVAARAGADYVKFQTAIPEEVISCYAPKAEYQKETTGGGESQLDMCRRIHLPLSDYARLARICRDRGIGFMSTPFDLPSIDCLARLDMDYWKIPSGEITNLPYLRKVAAPGRRIILSTGMSQLDEVAVAVDILCKGGVNRHDISLLHCTTQYPTPYDAVNLRAMEALRGLDVGAVGYSDHTLGIEVPVAAVAMGAQIIEKHFTLDTSMEGPDHRASLDPQALAAMVSSIRHIEQAIGSGVKTVADAERPNILIARKSIVARCAIAAGEIFTEENLTVKRPADGLSPMLWDTVIGRPAPHAFLPDQPIEL